DRQSFLDSGSRVAAGRDAAGSSELTRSMPNPSGKNLSGPSMHGLGVACGIAAGAWLGSAEAPTKLVDAGYSPIVISLCMVAGVFTARWTLPTLMKGTRYVFADLRTKAH